MSKAEHIATFVVLARINLAHDQLRVALQRLNVEFTGVKTAPGTFEASDEHKESHYNVHRAYDVALDVGLCSDGRLYVIGVHNGD